MNIYEILPNCNIKKCKLKDLEKETILEFLSKNDGSFFMTQTYGPDSPLGDTDYHEFLTNDGTDIFIGYKGGDSFLTKYGSLCYDPSKYCESEEEKEFNEHVDELIINKLKSGPIWYVEKLEIKNLF